MARHQDEYKEFQDAYEAVEGEWDEDWSNEERQRYYENLKGYNDEYVYHLFPTNNTLLRLLKIHQNTSQARRVQPQQS